MDLSRPENQCVNDFVKRADYSLTFIGVDDAIRVLSDYGPGVLMAKFCAAKRLLYKSLVRPVAEYACSVWNPASHKHHKQLEQVQKDFLKSIRLSKLPKGQHDTDFS
ncbi:hypothetical protein RvY_16709 [Ramazzottius varieornatus]|uniref:Uncharacterized protein n=1 Tax=Ramazzottius varieornatus TaxID=947166 RepID=A0A1D1W3R5_RAMVA|nr:hypothetical protein RvY_16709 [Ramazzottius varieornatus]